MAVDCSASRARGTPAHTKQVARRKVSTGSSILALSHRQMAGGHTCERHQSVERNEAFIKGLLSPL